MRGSCQLYRDFSMEDKKSGKPNLFADRRSLATPKYRCEVCSDTGLVPLPGFDEIVFAWEAAFTTKPCECEIGVRLAPAHESARNDPQYRRMWIESGRKL
jgi:hypothetical protein